MRSAAILLLLGLLGQPALGVGTETTDDWVRLDTSHFTLFGNADSATVVRLGSDLERLRSVLADLNPRRSINSPVATTVFIFRDQESFAEYSLRHGTRPANISGFFISHPHGNYVVIDASAGSNPSSIIYHEYLHEFARNNLPGIPLWFNEGLAEFYSTFVIEDGQATIGRPVAAHVEWLRGHDLLPMRPFLQTETDSRNYNETKRQGVFYAQSWALVHMLLAGDDSDRRALNDFLHRLSRGDDSEEALLDALATTYGELERKLKGYLRESQFAVFTREMELSDDEAAGIVRAVDRSETLYRLGDLLAHLNPPRLQEAEEHFSAALDEDPVLAEAWGGRGQIQMMRGDFPAASILFDHALGLDDLDARLWFLGAANQLRWAQTELQMSEPDRQRLERMLEEARRGFRRSLLLDDRFGEAWAGLGAAWLPAERSDREGLQALTEARRLLPSRSDVTYNLAVTLARQGDRDRATALIDDVLVEQASAEVVQQARESVLQTELDSANQYLAAGDLEAALLVYESVMDRTSDSVLLSRLVEKSSEIRALLETQLDYEIFERAMALARESRYDHAVELLEELAATTRDEELERVARENLRTLRRQR